jgi:hypothetical protein
LVKQQPKFQPPPPTRYGSGPSAQAKMPETKPAGGPPPPPTRYGGGPSAQAKMPETKPAGGFSPPPTRYGAGPVGQPKMSNPGPGTHRSPVSPGMQSPRQAARISDRQAGVAAHVNPPLVGRSVIQKMNDRVYYYDMCDENEDEGEAYKQVDTRPKAPTGLTNLVYDGLGKGTTEFECFASKHLGHCDNGKFKTDSNGKLSPRGSKEKKSAPPACHIVPWAAMKVYLDGQDDDVKKFVCWGNLDNLTTGYDRCNSSDSDALPTGWTKSDVKNYVKYMIKIYTDNDYETNVWYPEKLGFP